MRLFLVRHGETRWNQERRVQGGGSDIALNQRGQRQAERIGLALKGETIDAIYASPLRRALETALAIAHHHSLPVWLEPELKEIDTGSADGLTFEELPRRHPEFWAQWREGTGSIRWPGGESLEEHRERLWRTVQRLHGKHQQQTVVIVGHTFTVGGIILRALELEPGYFRRLRLETGSISLLRLDGARATLLRFNDTCHYQGL